MPAQRPRLSDACCPPLARQPLTAGEAAELAGVFKALADPVRLRLLSLIASYRGGEVCVCDMTSSFEVTGPTISHHLKVLREAGLIDSQRRGTWVYYWVIPAMLDRIGGVFAPAETSLATQAAAGSP
jgi:ArsR family transcriptional regulator, arsenate/arsenite/antimonite-responsive transcriptional repressor